MVAKKGSVPRRTLGLVLEGRTEYEAIPFLLRRLGAHVVDPSVFNGQPMNASIPELVEYRLLKHVRTQLLKASGAVIVVLDREHRAQQASDLASAVTKEIAKQVRRLDGGASASRINVAVIDRTFENWVLADPEYVSRSKLLRRKNNLAGRVACHADDRDAKSLLQSVMAKGWYEKAVHGPQLAMHIRVAPGVRYCSRSFKAFVDLVTSCSGRQ